MCVRVCVRACFMCLDVLLILPGVLAADEAEVEAEQDYSYEFVSTCSLKKEKYVGMLATSIETWGLWFSNWYQCVHWPR